jgi:hypothetical protein
MKNNLKTVVVIIILTMYVTNISLSYTYYGFMLKNFFSSFDYNILSNLQFIFTQLLLALDVTLCIVFLASQGEYKDKVYKLLRYLYVMGSFLYLPWTLYYYLSPDSYFYKVDFGWNTVMQFAFLAIHWTCVVLFLRAKPDTQPANVDLSEYELVGYTSMGHRFVHYLLDMLFLLPIFFNMSESISHFFSRNVYMMELLFLLLYLLYCLLSEAIFRQTLGKMATGSCVASIGGQLTFGRVLGRTFARLIPFDRFSFLFRANWHDTTSNTTVVYVNTWEKVFSEEQPAPAH